MTQISTNLDSIYPRPCNVLGDNLLTGDSGWFDVTEYRAGSIQIIVPGGVSAGAVIFEQSNDGVNATPWIVCEPHLGVPITTAQTLAALSVRTFFGETSSRFVRVRISTAFVGGAVTAYGGFTAGPAFAGVMLANIIGTPAVTSTGTSTITPTAPTTFTLAAAATTNLTSVKATAGTLFGITASNSGATVRYLKLYNKASAPVLATDVPILVIALPVGAVPIAINTGTLGQRFSLGIAIAITNLPADTDATVIAAAEVKVGLSYL